MSIKCKLGFHDWHECICIQCSKNRDKQHDWTKDCEKCFNCGKESNRHHDFDGCKCKNCQQEKHVWKDGKCMVCGESESFIDKRDGKKYKIINIGTQVMMAENLAYDCPGCCSYDYDSKNRNKYGLLYDWYTAQKISPKGWHLPTKKEWDILCNFLGGNEINEKERREKIYEQLLEGGSSGFNALRGGYRYNKDRFDEIGSSVNFWSATTAEVNSVNHFAWAYGHSKENSGKCLEARNWGVDGCMSTNSKGLCFSVRLFRDI